MLIDLLLSCKFRWLRILLKLTHSRIIVSEVLQSLLCYRCKTPWRICAIPMLWRACMRPDTLIDPVNKRLIQIVFFILKCLNGCHAVFKFFGKWIILQSQVSIKMCLIYYKLFVQICCDLESFYNCVVLRRDGCPIFIRARSRLQFLLLGHNKLKTTLNPAVSQ